MDGRRRERRWIAVGIALAWCGGVESRAEIAPEEPRTWLVLQEEVATDVVADHEERVRSALERLRSSQSIEVFMMRDDGFATFVATAHAGGGATADALDTLPRALLGTAAATEVNTPSARVPPARLLTSRPTLAYRPKVEIADPMAASFFRYTFFRVTADNEAAFERHLQDRKALFEARGVKHPYDILSGTTDTQARLYMLATGAANRAALDGRARWLRKQLGAPGRRIDRALNQLAEPAGSLEGDLALSWAGTPVEARFAARGRPPGSWLPPAAPLEPLPVPAPPLVAVAEPLPTPPAPPAEKPEPKPTSAMTHEAIRDAVHAWSQAWSGQQVDSYLAHYAQTFRPPPGSSRAQWQAQRRQRLTQPRFIEVQLDNLVVDIQEPGRAQASFTQSYRADHFSDVVEKRLDLVAEDGHWRIERESVGE